MPRKGSRDLMGPFVRRSHLLVSALDREAVESASRHNADAVVLDLTGASSDAEWSATRSLLPDLIPIAGLGGAEVFVMVNRASAPVDIEASARPGLRGIVYPGAESEAEILKVHRQLDDLEEEAGIAPDTLRIIVLLDSATGVWNIRDIVRASDRVCSVGLDELNLCRNLGIVPAAEFDPFEYAKGRVVIEARASRVQPIGMSHPYGVLPESGDEAKIARLALRSKNLGFAGALCPYPSWVDHCNRAFAPPEDRFGVLPRDTQAVRGGGCTWYCGSPVSRHHDDDRRPGGRERPGQPRSVGAMRRARSGEGRGQGSTYLLPTDQ